MTKPLPTPATNHLPTAILAWLLMIFTLLISAWGLVSCSNIQSLLPLTNTPRAVAALAQPEVTITFYQPTHPTPSATPFLPITNTPTPTFTATPTETQTATVTASLTSTATPAASLTAIQVDTLTPMATDDGLPADGSIGNISGRDQALPLSCESRSAVDWAGFFGTDIGEMDFQNALPISDNPNTGFVGNPRGEPGQVPPNPYGVHSAPVARLLRAYGLPATEHIGMSWDDIRREIAQGRPVIVWVIGHVWTGYGFSYQAADGETMTVARYEHTVIVTAYTRYTVTVLDGGMFNLADLNQFLASWSVLGYMGITKE